MATFLMIVFAIFLLIAAVGVGLVIGLRAKIQQSSTDFRKIAPLLMEPYARLHLRACAANEQQGTPAIEALWSQLESQGFERRASFSDDGGARFYIAGQLPSREIAAVAVEVAGRAPYLEFMTVAASNSVRVLTGEPGARPVRVPALKVAPHPNPTLDTAIAAFASASAGCALDKNMLMLLIERVHAARMDIKLERAPTREDMLRHARYQGYVPNLSEEQLERALSLNHTAWQEAARVAMIDNARRKLPLGDADWARMQHELIVVHPQMGADEVIATLSQNDLVARLGEQLKRQDYAPLQIFDEINRRLDTRDQRQLLAEVNFPIRGRVYARSVAPKMAA